MVVDWKDLGRPKAGGVYASEHYLVIVELSDHDAQTLRENPTVKFRLNSFTTMAGEKSHSLGMPN